MGDRGEKGSVRVYKVGGSLFGWPELFGRLAALLRGEGGRPLLVSGGGAAADVVREWDRVHGMGEERSHRLAVKSLCLGEAFLAGGLDGAVVVARRGEAEEAWRAGQTPILCADRFLEAEEGIDLAPLPRCWGVTSDSIAAWVAARWPAELLLLKSASPQRAGEPFVDPFFTNVIGRVGRAGWVDLRTGERGDFAALRPE